MQCNAMQDNDIERSTELLLFYSILGCVLPLQEVALRQSPPSFSVLCCPCPYRSLLPHNVISPTPFWSSDCSHFLPLVQHTAAKHSTAQHKEHNSIQVEVASSHIPSSVPCFASLRFWIVARVVALLLLLLLLLLVFVDS